MTSSSHAAPLRYHPSMEQAASDEPDVARELMETMRGICETTFKHGGHAIRSVHAKSHGLLQGRCEVLPRLEPSLAQGMFTDLASYPVVMRFSTTPGDLLPDGVSTPRGLAIKIIGVPGERLPDSEAAVTQDFLMVNGPAFAAPDGKGFLKNLKLLASTTDRAPKAKEWISSALRGVEHVVEAFGGQSGAIKSLGGHPMTNLLGETYFTQVPVLYGAYVAKLCMRPSSANLKALKDAKLDLKHKPDGLREAVVDFFSTNEAMWELCVQLCTDLKTMPIEDASVEWPQSESPYIPVAHIRVSAQTAWSADLSAAIDDGLSFSPWHGIAAHRPLGSIMRVRKLSYDMSARFRAEHNHVSIQEPKTATEVLSRP